MNEALIAWLMTAPDVPDERLTLDDFLRRPEWHQRAACRGVGVDAFEIPTGGRCASPCDPEQPSVALLGREFVSLDVVDHLFDYFGSNGQEGLGRVSCVNEHLWVHFAYNDLSWCSPHWTQIVTEIVAQHVVVEIAPLCYRDDGWDKLLSGTFLVCVDEVARFKLRPNPPLNRSKGVGS